MTGEKSNLIKCVCSVINKIKTELDEKPIDPYLFGIGGGMILFLENYSKIFPSDFSQLFLNSIYYFNDFYNSFGYTNKIEKSSINWLYTYLNRNDIIANDDHKLLCNNIELINNASLFELRNGNYDFISGAIGMAYYSLYQSDNFDTNYYEEIFNILADLYSVDNTNIFYKYENKPGGEKIKAVNLGIAHGITGILKLCVQCYKLKICTKESHYYSYKIINYLINNTNKNISISYFPSIIEINNANIESSSRLAWCYGDLGIAYILFQAGQIFNDKKLIDFSEKILIHSTKRRTISETFVMDATFCHGSAGIAHIYSKMWHKTLNPIFKEACQYWLIYTLKLSLHQDGAAGYRKYNPISKIYENELGLLEGICGIGLVLISYITGDFSWDYCVMLND